MCVGMVCERFGFLEVYGSLVIQLVVVLFGRFACVRRRGLLEVVDMHMD